MALISAEEAAAITGLHRKTIYVLIRASELREKIARGEAKADNVPRYISRHLDSGFPRAVRPLPRVVRVDECELREWLSR